MGVNPIEVKKVDKSLICYKITLFKDTVIRIYLTYGYCAAGADLEKKNSMNSAEFNFLKDFPPNLAP